MDQAKEIGRLFEAPLDQFVGLRDDLARRLKAAGDREAADQVKSLRKPTISAWIVNQLARTHQTEVARLIAAGEALETAQRRALSGETDVGYAAARGDENEAIRRLRQAIVEIVPSVAPTVLERVTNTLRAGAATAEGRETIGLGQMAGDLEPHGFEAFAGTPIVAAPDTSADGGEADGREEELRSLKRGAEEAAKVAAKEARQAERDARQAENQARAAERAAVAARRRADEAAERVRKLGDELSELRKRR